MAISINGSTGISGVNGSAATPAIQGGDSDTGIFFGTDTASIATNGNPRLVVDANGNINIDSGGVYYDAANNRLGVGISTPRGIIHVGADLNSGATDAAAINIKQTSTTKDTGIYLERSTDRRGHYIYISSTEDALTFERNNLGTSAVTMVMDRSGKVGVGTSAPWTNTEIRGANVAGGVDSRNSATPPSNLFIGVDGFAQNTGGSISFGSDRDSASDYCAYGAIAARRDSNLSYVYSGHLTFSTSSGSTLDEQWKIASNGLFSPVNTAVGDKIHLPGSFRNLKLGNTFTLFYVNAGSGTGVFDTGISVNQGNAGATMLLFANLNSSAGTATSSAIYAIQFYYDGNHTPTKGLLSTSTGVLDDFVTVGKSATNTLTLQSSSGNWSFACLFLQ